MRPLRFLLVLLLVPMALVIGNSTGVRADQANEPSPDENRDVATPNVAPRDTWPVEAATTMAADATVSVFAATVARVEIDDFQYDDLVLEGTAREVCAGRLLTGSGWTYNEIVSRFGGTPGTMYYCRERWDVANDPACNGQLASPVTTPNFRSTCWSNHAQGRAIDVMVGRSGSGYNTQRGINIVNWLLATDANGNVNANARKLGIQQILFNNRCWNSDGDRGIAGYLTMRSCDVGHTDHVHIDLTIDGASGNVSYWGAEPKVEGKLDTQAFWDFDSWWRQAVSWWHMVPNDEEGIQIPAQYDQVLVGDFDSDGLQDETFLWDQETGQWAVQNWNDGDALTATIGVFSGDYDTFVIGDFDADGFMNDMLLWDSDGTGNFTISSWQNYLPKARRGGLIWTEYDDLVAGDFDGDGINNELMAWNEDDGLNVVWQATAWQLKRRRMGYLPKGADQLIVGDWSAGGDLDDVIYWDNDNGRWALYTYINFTPTRILAGSWSTVFDIAAPGDYDTDGRIDDLFIYDVSAGHWRIYSFHRNSPTLRTSGQWSTGFDVITVGSFLD